MSSYHSARYYNTSRRSSDPQVVANIARCKMMRESARPEHELRLLLAHVRILDQLEHSPAELQHTTSYERERPKKRASRDRQEVEDAIARQESVVQDEDEEEIAKALDAFFQKTRPTAETTSISVEEVSDDDDWLA